MIELKISLSSPCPAMIARSTPSDLNVLISLPSCPRDIQCTVFACCSMSGKVSSLMAATTISIPWLRAASSTRKGNFPFPAIRPYLLDDATFGALDEFENRFGLRRGCPRLQLFHCLRCVQFRLQQKPEGTFDFLNLFRGETFSLQADQVRTVGLRVTLAHCLGIRQH